MKRIYLILTCFLFAYSATAEQTYSVGFRAIEQKNGFLGGVWYPSSDKEYEKKWGPFRPVWAWDGAPVAGKFPTLLFSHGVTGRYRNHRDTAAALAEQGYVVIAPQHTKDQLINFKEMDALEHRIAEFSRALEKLSEADSEIAEIIDRQNIGAIGYSLGGLTALSAAGAIPSMQYVEEHCGENVSLDPDFCGGKRVVHRILAMIMSDDFMHRFNKKGFKGIGQGVINQIEPPLNFKAIALIAPVAAAYYPKQIQDINAAIAIFRLETDTINRFPFHAEHLHKSLGTKEHVYKTFPRANHYAFISPFPEWLLEQEDIPVAIQPKGFDKKIFLDEINSDILAFFTKNMPVVQHAQ